MDITNPGHLKIALLAQGMRITETAKYGLGSKFQEKVYSYVTTDWVNEKRLLPSDIKLDGRVFVGFHYKPLSRWELDREPNRNNGRDRLVLRLNGDTLTNVELIPRPVYYDMRTSDDIPIQAVGVSCANHGVSFFINEYCQYFSKGEQCRFCSLVPTHVRSIPIWDNSGSTTGTSVGGGSRRGRRSQETSSANDRFAGAEEPVKHGKALSNALAASL